MTAKTSSASAGTRKKNQAKKAAKQGSNEQSSKSSQQSNSNNSGKTKKEKQATKLKRGVPKPYTPPPKPPQPAVPDPLDALGLASSLPAELVVVLRRLGKKDEITRRRALEEFDNWLEKAKNDENEHWWVEVIGPVWLHHLPPLLFTSRLTPITLQTHQTILTLFPSLLSTTLPYLLEFQQRNVLGTLLSSSLQSSSVFLQTFINSVSWSVNESTESQLELNSYLGLLTEYLSSSILDPSAIWESVFPPVKIASAGGQTKGGNQRAAQSYKGRIEQGGKNNAGKKEELEESEKVLEEERVERELGLRIGGLVGLSWVLREYPQSEETGTSLSEDLVALLSTPYLWSALSNTTPTSETSAPLGYGQTSIRKAAWDCLKALLLRWPGIAKANLEILTGEILGTCWNESEVVVLSSVWDPLLLFLTKFPEAWTIEKTMNAEEDQIPAVQETEQANNDDGNQNDVESKIESSRCASPEGGSPAYSAFLDFLRSGCRGAPVNGYLILVVVLSTLPTEIFPLTESSFDELFQAIWAPLPSLLSSSIPQIIETLLSTVLETATFLFTKQARLSPDNVDSSRKFLAGQVGLCWDLGVLGLLRVRESEDTSSRPRRGVLRGGRQAGEEIGLGVREARVLGTALGKIVEIDPKAGELGWSEIVSNTLGLLTGPSGTHAAEEEQRDDEENETLFPLAKLPSVLAALRTKLPAELEASFIHLLGVVGRLTVGSLIQEFGDWEEETKNGGEEEKENQGAQLKNRTELVLELIALESLGAVLREDEIFARVVDALLANETTALFSLLPSSASARLYRVYFHWRAEKEPCEESYHSLCDALRSSSSLSKDVRFPIILELTAEFMGLPIELADGQEQGEPIGLDDVANVLIESLEKGNIDEEGAEVLASLVVRPTPFLTPTSVRGAVEKVFLLLNTTVRTVLFDDSSLTRLSHLEPILSLLKDSLPQQSIQDLLASDLSRDLVVSLFDTGHFVPLLFGQGQAEDVKNSARDIWKTLLGRAGDQEDELINLVMVEARKKLEDTSSQISVEILWSGLNEASVPYAARSVLSPFDLFHLLPPASTIVDQLNSISVRQLPPALAVIDPLVPQLSEDEIQPSVDRVPTDSAGFGSFARLATTLIACFAADRSLLRQDPSWLRILTTFGIFASDEVALPRSSAHVFGERVSKDVLGAIVLSTDSLRSYALSSLSSSIEPVWYGAATSALTTGKIDSEDKLVFLLAGLLGVAKSEEDIYAARVLRDLLAGVLFYSGANAEDAEKWLMFGRTLQDKAPQSSVAITLATKDICLESTKLDRFQNELAADLTGLKASAVNTKGLRALRLLAATAPPPESSAIFLPELRATRLMQVLQEWMTGDEEDLSEELDSRVAEMFLHLGPIVQNDLSRFEFVFDLLEANLEAASWDDPASLPFLAHTLRLLAVVRDLAFANKALKEVWIKRKDASLDLVFNLFLSEKAGEMSQPLSICRGLVVDLVDQLSINTLTPDRFGPLCLLLNDPSVDVQTTAHGLLKQMIERTTADLVVQVEVETDNEIDIKLPKELIETVVTSLELPVADNPAKNFGILLGWDLIFSHFNGASLKIKSSYIEQLRNEELVAAVFIPTILTLLNVSETKIQLFDLAPWAVDEFIIDLYDPETPYASALFGAHLFYQALIVAPSLIRNWWSDQKDRQLSMAVSTFTSRFFSPVVIDHELSTLRDPDSMADLQDGDLTVKILPAVNEVNASYVVDEQPMEITVRLPSDYPLHGVEVRDVRRVGVDERKWKAWLLAVQQVVTTRDGLVLDALTLFKRNVSLHFAGVTDCAICYSIISVTDRTLPTRQCRTTLF
ncbi:Predicted E3 ubiquitin ligase [Phaffia rhodozyma]|uniref:E3 ubiquitin-protein ligase listerin n=1 Tax=Phaffia rhodozyma TaxID=264483 RepID=A0A0F7STI4_PHARH|nr:Predicted E3 ubiquitin ligase [Phaffia rhodozyma]